MGIKFRCPNGHKLNVKGFLAGKKGVCPDCGARFRIPLQEVEDDLFDGSAIGACGIRRKPPILIVAPLKSHKAETSPTFDEVIQVVAVLDSEQVQSTPRSLARVASPTPPIITRPQAAPDVIDENPAASWYVRPPSGGQYGPAQGESMRRWLGEGRVTGGSLVWREGWTDWRSAAEVFPQLGLGSAIDSFSAQIAPLTLPPPVLSDPALAAPAATTRMTGTPSAGKGNSTLLTATIVGGLLLVGCVMVVILIYLISQA